MKWIVFLILVLLSAGGVELWMLRRGRAEAICQSVHALARNVAPLEKWLSEAAAEPYLGDAALRGEPMAAIASFRARARAFAEVPEFIPPPVTNALRTLAGAGLNPQEALAAFPPSLQNFQCREPPPATSVEAALEREISAAEEAFTARKLRVPHDRAEFARDLVIFCKGDQILARLKTVAEAAAKKCQQAKPGTKMAKGCAAKQGDSALEAEMKDVEAEKAVNERKLRQKWPAAVVTAGLKC
jgi:hypothetical protein